MAITTANEREFPLPAVLSIICDMFLANVADVEGLISFMIGVPEGATAFPDGIWLRCKDALIAQNPVLGTIDPSNVHEENRSEWLQEQAERLRGVAIIIRPIG